jgi:hypothetical protein
VRRVKDEGAVFLPESALGLRATVESAQTLRSGIGATDV